MANSETGLSSDAARASGGEYQVFLNFRGLDTRYGFTDFLYHSLMDAGVHVFRDEDKLSIGEVIGENLLHAINNSIIYIPIFSATYASSKWCLRELAHIRDNVSQSKGKKSILPIFFHVEPEDVKLKTPLYSNALLEHEKKFPIEVKVWRKALAEVDEIKGWNVKKDQSQAMLVKLVVKRVLEKLKLKQRLVPEHLVRLDDRVEHLTEFLDVNHRDVRLIGIYGMGGIGKTTIAKVVFNKLTCHFGKCCSFLEDVRESMSTEDGIVRLQKKLLSDTVDSGYAAGVKDSEQGMRRIGEILGTKKVLLVLDDVNNEDHVKKLIGNNSLHSGSRIIITTRNKAILQDKGFGGEIILYEMLKMNAALALELFCWHAFGIDFPLDGYHVLSNEIISSTGGLPLAVKVIGSLLNRKDKAFWEETTIKLRNVPEEQILKKLRISYDDLNEHQQQIFLDIACFFFNKKKTDAIYMWANCGFYPVTVIELLTSRCLIKILDDDKFWMHDQLIEMGRHIVRQESPSDPAKRSRVWIAKEAVEVMRTKKKKYEVRALEINGWDGFIEITNKEFERLPNLTFLELRNGTFAGDFAKCHSNLRWISWQPPPQDSRADNMNLNYLVVFKLGKNRFKDDSKAWDLIKGARFLKVLSLTGCHGIKTIPDLSKCSLLERLTLARCNQLERIERFIGKLQFLIELEIKECPSLTNLPEEMAALVKLKRFSLRGCSKLGRLLDSLGSLTLLRELELSMTGIGKLPNSIGKLQSLRVLCFAKSFRRKNLKWQLPSDISTLVNLEELDLSGHCDMIGEIPAKIGELSSLEILNLKSVGIYRIPGTINMLHHLQTLNLLGCHQIQALPKLPTSLKCLLLQSESLFAVPNLSNLTSLVELQLSNAKSSAKKSKSLTGFNLSWIERLSKLKKLVLNLQDVLAPPQLASLSYLENLVLENLDLDWEVEDIPLKRLIRLEELTIKGCKRIQRFSIPLELGMLRKVDVSSCEELVEIQVVRLSTSLESFYICSCNSLTRISGLSYLKNLEKLKILWCNLLTTVEGLNELESLNSLEVKECMSLRMLIDTSCTNIPNDCVLDIEKCGDSIKDFKSEFGISLKRYKEEILRETSNKLERPFTVIFYLVVEGPSVGVKKRIGSVRTKNATSVTYEGLIADVKCCGYPLRRMWYVTPSEDCKLNVEIKSDEEVQEMMLLASERRSIELVVEIGVDGEWEGGYDDMIQELRLKWVRRNSFCSDKDEFQSYPLNLNDISDSTSVGKSETRSTFPDDSQSEPDSDIPYSRSVGERETRSTFSDDFHSEPSRSSQSYLLNLNDISYSTSVGKRETRSTFPDDSQSEPGSDIPYSRSVGERETRSTFSDDFHSEPGRRSRHSGASKKNRKKGKGASKINRKKGKGASKKNRKEKGESGKPCKKNGKEKGESGKPADQNWRKFLGKGPTLGKGATVSLGMGTTKIGASLRSGAEKSGVVDSTRKERDEVNNEIFSTCPLQNRYSVLSM